MVKACMLSKKSSESSKGPARCVMVLGTTSGAGKSWLTTALCRWYANQGLKVAPFKAQNMSNNARVVAGVPDDAGQGTWGEIGSAQYFQALAARAEPDVRMNPLQLKPEADTHSQVVLMGRVNRELSDTPWRGRSLKVWPQIAAALDELRAENDVVVIEGAGSPAEINLYDSDIVNMRVARHADAACLLVSDIDRGGAFAHLYGTWALLPEADRALIKGFVLNKFRGDASLLAPAPQMLQDLTGIPTVATIPMQWHHGLPEEDGVFDDRTSCSGTVRLTVAVVAYPRISNLDEFQPLKNVSGVRLVWARTPADLAGADWVVLPGSKSTLADLAWLRQQGLDAAVCAHASGGGAVLGICGGLQMLGEAIVDPLGVESQHALACDAPGLGLLPLVTAFGEKKTVRRTHTRFGELAGAWGSLSGISVSGYEIHLGETAQHPAMAAKGDVAQVVLPGGLGWQSGRGNVLGLYLHGLFEDPAVLQALWGSAFRTLDEVFDDLAAQVAQSFDAGWLQTFARSNFNPASFDEKQRDQSF
jgi:adenosylcobyric acid synthase